MNVALTFPDCHRRGGVERIMVECANFLASRGHHASVFSAAFDDGVLSGPHACPVPVAPTGTVARLRAYRAASSQRWQDFKAASAKDGARCVHAAFGVTGPPEGVLWVQSVHAEWIKIARASRGFLGRLKQRLNPFHPFILKLENDYYRGRQYRKLIALTPRIKQELIEHYAVPQADIEILPNGYNPQEFNPQRRLAQRDAVRKELKCHPDDKLLLFVANELERKGFFPLADALARLKNPHIKLAVVGKAPLAPHQGLLNRLGIASQVIAVGPSPDVGRYFAAADLFVLPTYYEAWGLVIVEALATGIPVLTSKLAGAAVAIDERIGAGLLLNDPKSPDEITAALQKLIAAPAADPQTISHSVSHYQWSTLLQTYENILLQNAA